MGSLILSKDPICKITKNGRPIQIRSVIGNYPIYATLNIKPVELKRFTRYSKNGLCFRKIKRNELPFHPYQISSPILHPNISPMEINSNKLLRDNFTSAQYYIKIGWRGIQKYKNPISPPVKRLTIYLILILVTVRS